MKLLKFLLITAACAALSLSCSQQPEIVPLPETEAVANDTSKIAEPEPPAGEPKDTTVYDGSKVIFYGVVSNGDGDTIHTPQPDPPAEEITAYNINILDDAVTEVSVERERIFFAMNALSAVPLKIVLHSANTYVSSYVHHPEPVNWKFDFTDYFNGNEYKTAYQVNKLNEQSRLWITFFPGSSVQMEFYENGSETPAKTKTLRVKYTGDTELFNPVDSTFVYPSVR